MKRMKSKVLNLGNLFPIVVVAMLVFASAAGAQQTERRLPEAPIQVGTVTEQKSTPSPPYFGTFAEVEERLIELKPSDKWQESEVPIAGTPKFRWLVSLSGTNVTAPNVRFVLYDRAVRTVLPEIKLFNAAYVVMIAVPYEPLPTGLIVSPTLALPLGKWVPSQKIDFRVFPVPDNPDMVRVEPYSPLAPGVYVLEVGNRVFDFTLNWDPSFPEIHRHNLLLRTNGTSSLVAYSPPPVRVSEAKAQFWVRHITTHVNVFCVGRLYVFDDRIRYSASPATDPQAHGFEVSCADIKEVKKNGVFARPYGFHIRTKSENFNFIPASSEFEAILGTLGLINLNFTGSETIPRPDPIVEAVSACMARNVGSR